MMIDDLLNCRNIFDSYSELHSLESRRHKTLGVKSVNASKSSANWISK